MFPLYSRRYFESDNCGREWFAFARREVMHRAEDGEAVDAIVPALWHRMDRETIPEVAQSFQYDHADLGARYCAEGFYGIMKLQNYRAIISERSIASPSASLKLVTRVSPMPMMTFRHLDRKDFESLRERLRSHQRPADDGRPAADYCPGPHHLYFAAGAGWRLLR